MHLLWATHRHLQNRDKQTESQPRTNRAPCGGSVSSNCSSYAGKHPIRQQARPKPTARSTDTFFMRIRIILLPFICAANGKSVGERLHDCTLGLTDRKLNQAKSAGKRSVVVV